MKHSNLFDSVDDHRAFYATLQKDFARDEKRCYYAQFVGVAAIVIAAAYGNLDPRWQWLLAGVAANALFVSLIAFIDNSNRNWTMHMIDWMQHRTVQSSEE